MWKSTLQRKECGKMSLSATEKLFGFDGKRVTTPTMQYCLQGSPSSPGRTADKRRYSVRTSSKRPAVTERITVLPATIASPAPPPRLYLQLRPIMFHRERRGLGRRLTRRISSRSSLGSRETDHWPPPSVSSRGFPSLARWASPFSSAAQAKLD